MKKKKKKKKKKMKKIVRIHMAKLSLTVRIKAFEHPFYASQFSSMSLNHGFINIWY